MHNKNNEILKHLHDLLQTNEDSIKGYKDAADHLEEGELSTIFYRLSQQRALFKEELKKCIRELGGEENEHTDLSHEVQRLWMNFKAGLNGSDTKKIIEDCKKADKQASENYEKALKADPPAYIKEILANQHRMIKGAEVQLEEFKKHPEGR
ncbi:PA2169 family four-helix-bundle protein [Litoribacter populi]|uniref:PA2169 family four-helix-bundle protein n=1 Tax=Litoribacter populi TaxID=2598460 RepID=UPI00117EC7E7|nr:PA2169 family four-helix-bundle protein [Litoribacter populi]